MDGTDFSENSAWEAAARKVLAGFGRAPKPGGIKFLGGGGGFSGSLLWRVSTEFGDLCLRRWPNEHPTPQRLEWIHRVICHVADQGVPFLAIPGRTPTGETYIRHDGHLWELTPWLHGVADYRCAPSAEKLTSALGALAEFHVAAATFLRPAEQCVGTSSGIASRLDRLQFWLIGGLQVLRSKMVPGDWPELAVRAEKLIQQFPARACDVKNRLRLAKVLTVPLQPCLRDIWHDHVLFSGDRVTGLIDYGAMRIESVAADVARLLGSLVGDDLAGWQTGLAAYEAIRPLSPEERQLITAFDQSTVLLGGLEWLDWIYLQGRTFENRAGVELRLDEILSRLSGIR